MKERIPLIVPELVMFIFAWNIGCTRGVLINRRGPKSQLSRLTLRQNKGILWSAPESKAFLRSTCTWGIMEKKMETTGIIGFVLGVIVEYIGVILGLLYSIFRQKSITRAAQFQ